MDVTCGHLTQSTNRRSRQQTHGQIKMGSLPMLWCDCRQPAVLAAVNTRAFVQLVDASDGCAAAGPLFTGLRRQ